jgi:hypothetical protein
MTVAQLRDFAEARGLTPPKGPSGVRFPVEDKTFGRYGCRVEFADGVVRSSRYDASNSDSLVAASV